MKTSEPNSNLQKAILLDQGEIVVFQGAPNLKQSIWQCYRVLLDVSGVFGLVVICFAYYAYALSFLHVIICLASYFSILFLLSLIDAYTDRDVDYFLTNKRVIKLKAGKIQKQLSYTSIRNIKHKEKDGRGFFIFVGEENNKLSAISFLGLEKTNVIYAALPVNLKKIADASKKEIF